jgi:hypothetical protein
MEIDIIPTQHVRVRMKEKFRPGQEFGLLIPGGVPLFSGTHEVRINWAKEGPGRQLVEPHELFHKLSMIFFCNLLPIAMFYLHLRIPLSKGKRVTGRHGQEEQPAEAAKPIQARRDERRHL